MDGEGRLSWSPELLDWAYNKGSKDGNKGKGSSLLLCVLSRTDRRGHSRGVGTRAWYEAVNKR